MAETNGTAKLEDTVSVATSHLGKRKRTSSPAPLPSPVHAKDGPLQTALQEVLRHLRKHDSTPSLLTYPLSSSPPGGPDPKRARLLKSEPVGDSIEERILTGQYHSFQALKDDVHRVSNGMLADLAANNETPSSPSSVTPAATSQLSELVKILDAYEHDASEFSTTDGEDLPQASPPSQSPTQILSLRSQVNGSTQVLFSGLPLNPTSSGQGTATVTETRPTLPNGFELVDFADLGGDAQTTKQEKRHFNQVFRPMGRIKQLDAPQPAKDVVRSTTIDFIPPANQTVNLPQHKHDYKFAKLPTGQWLSYGTVAAQPQQERSKVSQLSPEALYSSVYSSFAPSSDNTSSLISERDRSRHWWQKYGPQTLSKFLAPLDSGDEWETNDIAAKDDEFAELVATFIPEEDEEILPLANEAKQVDDLLEEVSEMIETLSSCQRNRSLEKVAAGSVPKPSSTEFDVFEMLRDQLNLLISSLPPFAVAKLNGDQLEEMNISTRLVVEAPDYPGTGQPDDYSLRRQKMSQQATSAASRNPTPLVRPNYSQPPANPITYNPAGRNYNASVPATAAYGMRGSQTYQTPQATRPTFSQTPYQPSGTQYPSRPTIQQFQRSLQNGYGNYTGTPGPPQTPRYGQQASQPGYQQRAQEAALATAARSASPQKPLVNGQHYPPRQYTAQQAQTPSAYQRPGSGTPTTPIAAAPAGVGAGYGRFDGTSDKGGREGSRGGAASPASVAIAQKTATASQSPSQIPAQTVEVSR